MGHESDKHANDAGLTGGADDRVERLLQELRPIDLPPFFRTRLLARLRAASRQTSWVERLRTPRLAWSVAGVCAVALVVVVAHVSRVGPRTDAGVPGIQMAAIQASIDPVMPADNSVVGAGDVEIVAAIYPPIEGGIIRLYVDETDVTGLAEVTDDYVMYSPGGRFEEGEHIVTIEIRDGSGKTLKDFSWLFYTLNGRKSAADERI